VAGIVLLAAGLAMMVLPGPGIVVTLLALALLAREYTWARKLLDVCREKASRTAARAKQRIRS
jgi:uncharacterized protein (TIGR02611 family)